MKLHILIGVLACSSTVCMAQEEGSGDDHYAIWRMDSINEMNFSTRDLAAMEVRGHVKRIVWNQGGWVVTFDQQGNMTDMTDDTSEYMLGHDEDGNLTSYAVGAGSVSYGIDPKTNLLSVYSGGEGSACWTNNYKYDSKGNLYEIEYNNEDVAEGTKTTTREKVKVLEKDAHNNWISRKIGNNITKRTIIYYPNSITDEPDPEEGKEAFRPFKGKYSFVGTIGGDDNCTMTIENGEGSYHVAIGERLISTDRYDPVTGNLEFMAFIKSSGQMTGTFKGTYKDGRYTGVFENTKGGKVNFNLRRK